MILASKNIKFTEEQLNTIKNGCLPSDEKYIEVTVEELNEEVERLFTDEKEAVDRLIERCAK